MVDVQGQIDAVDRGVESGDEFRVQTLGQTYKAAISDVWHAITSPDRIPRWFLPITGDLVLGGRYQLEGNAGGTVEECAPPDGGDAHFRVTWEYGGGAPTWLTVRLHELAPDSTRLELHFEGRIEDVPAEMWDQFGPSATGIGWDQGLLGLALYLHDVPDRVTPEEGAAWSLSPEGREFIRLSADAWARAHMADGGDESVARAAADATYAMYTGAA
jgi:uncharacterized protein YndB with AHSA1/START domain